MSEEDIKHEMDRSMRLRSELARLQTVERKAPLGKGPAGREEVQKKLLAINVRANR